MISYGILAAFGATLFWGFGDFLIQRSTRKLGVTESLGIIGVIGSIGLFPFIVKDLHVLFSFENGLLLILLSIIIYAVSYLDFEALEVGKLSIIDVIFEIELPITVILGFLFLDESHSPIQLFLIREFHWSV